MKINKTKLQGILTIELDCFKDQRGFFLETYHAKRYQDHGISDSFIQENHSRSLKGVLRGMHYQKRKSQAQLVTIMHGAVYYVCVDLRRESSTFGVWHGVELCDSGIMQLYMSSGFAGGYCVLSEVADLHYNVSELYEPNDEGGLLWSDPDVNIDWPISNLKINTRDSEFPKLVNIPVDAFPLVNT